MSALVSTGRSLAPGVLVEAATWVPVRTVVTRDGWRIGLSGGVTRRANSVLPLGTPDDLPAALDEVERLYASVGRPTVFRVGPAAGDGGLARLLDERGYVVGSDTAVLVRSLAAPLPEHPVGGHVQLATRPDDAWLDGWLGVKGSGLNRAAARTIVGGSPAHYLTLVEHGRPVGVIRAAYAQDWVGLSCLAVAPSARRRGLGRELTQRALVVAREHGAERAFLQVEVGNHTAERLYAALGFVTADTYRYIERPHGA